MIPMHCALIATALLSTLVHPLHADLAEEMSLINKGTKKLQRLEGDYEAGSKIAQEMLETTKRATAILPEMIGKIEDADARKKAEEDYRKLMTSLAEAYTSVDDACKKKDAAALTAALDTLKKLKKEGHTRFEVD